MDEFSRVNQPNLCRWLNDISCTDTMIHRASIHRPAGHRPEDEAIDALTLDFDTRHRRRICLTTDQGEKILLDLPGTIAIADGDGLQLEHGGCLKVQAATELVIEVRHRDPELLMRLAWHLGNRHLPTEIRNEALRIRPDHVIEDMLHRFGAALVKMQAPFQPEGGAYSGQDRRQDESGHHHHEHDC